MSQNKTIYADYAATTPLDKRVFLAMQPFLETNFGNPNSIHALGQKALVAIDYARDQVAKLINAEAGEIIFTPSATIANNLIISGLINNNKPHFITSSIEHPSILEVVNNLQKNKLIELDLISPDKEGTISADEVLAKIKANTIFVSIMMANNETGTINNIARLGKKIKAINEARTSKIIFHTDAVQAVRSIKLDIKVLRVDALTLSAHKMYGPKGVGALYIHKDVKLEPLIFGGGQERGLMPGTQNTAAVVGMGEAAKILQKELESDYQHDSELKEIIINKLINYKLNGNLNNSLPGIINLQFSKTEADILTMKLDRAGLAVSSGSACAAGAIKKSYVLKEMGLSVKEIDSSIRLSFGRFSTKKEVLDLIQIIQKVAKN
ncbi:MAG: cysteine desulfurase family protein [bacterium]